MMRNRVFAEGPYTADPLCAPPYSQPRCRRVRELVVAYRPMRDQEGRIISVPSVALSTPSVAAQIIAPLLADQPVELFAVACLSARNRLI